MIARRIYIHVRKRELHASLIVFVSGCNIDFGVKLVL
jgi:hypothetical protein